MNKATWLTVLLIVSIGINMLFVGFMIGRNAGSSEAKRKQQLEWTMQDLSEETRKHLRRTLREHMQDSRPLRKEMREAQRNLHRVVTAEEYDETAVAEGFERLRAASVAVQASMHAQVTRALSELDRPDRLRVFRTILNRTMEGPQQQEQRRLRQQNQSTPRERQIPPDAESP